MSDRASRQVVLVVEDEPIQRMMAVDVAESAGFDVIEAASAAEAVRVLETRTDIRIVFTDIDMPGSMDGMQLAAAIRGRWPPIKLILTSGLYGRADVKVPPPGVFFQKPYDKHAVVAAMRKMAA